LYDEQEVEHKNLMNQLDLILKNNQLLLLEMQLLKFDQNQFLFILCIERLLVAIVANTTIGQ
jgi:hypothetical protein